MTAAEWRHGLTSLCVSAAILTPKHSFSIAPAPLNIGWRLVKEPWASACYWLSFWRSSLTLAFLGRTTYFHKCAAKSSSE